MVRSASHIPVQSKRIDSRYVLAHYLSIVVDGKAGYSIYRFFNNFSTRFFEVATASKMKSHKIRYRCVRRPGYWYYCITPVAAVVRLSAVRLRFDSSSGTSYCLWKQLCMRINSVAVMPFLLQRFIPNSERGWEPLLAKTRNFFIHFFKRQGVVDKFPQAKCFFTDTNEKPNPTEHLYFNVASILLI